MTKGISFKFALLGCVSSCLMSAAYANTSNEGIVTLELLAGEDIRGVTCGADDRYYTFQLTNGTDDDLTIRKIHVENNSGHDSPIDFHHFVRNTTPVSGECQWDGNVLDEGDDCLITVKVDADSLDCGSAIPVEAVFTGELEVEYSDAEFSEIEADITIPVTIVGSGDDVSLLGQNLCGTEYSQQGQCDIDSLSNLAATNVTVDQDLVATSETAYISSNIVSVNGDKYRDDDIIAENAKSDVKAAFNNIMDLAIDGPFLADAQDSSVGLGFSSNCRLLAYDWFNTPVDPMDLSLGNVERTISGGGLYCFTTDDGDTLPGCDDVEPVVINTNVIVETTQPAIFVINPEVCDPRDGSLPDDFYALVIGEDGNNVANFNVDTDIGDPRVSAGNLYFFVDGKAEMHAPAATSDTCDPTTDPDCDYNLAGRYILEDYFEADAGDFPANIIGNIYSTRGSVGLVEGYVVNDPNPTVGTK